jgi:hypothetical protein
MLHSGIDGSQLQASPPLYLRYPLERWQEGTQSELQHNGLITAAMPRTLVSKNLDSQIPR